MSRDVPRAESADAAIGGVSSNDQINATDRQIGELAIAVARRLDATGLAGTEIRERVHLDPFTKDECERRYGVRPLSRTLRTPDFPGVGPVDVVLEGPRALCELKWAYQSPGKIFESVWDAIKLALLGTANGYETLYVWTGASIDEWSRSESVGLFTESAISPLEMWGRPLVPRRGPNYGRTVGEDLVIGARGNRPRRVHERIAIRPVVACRVAGSYELRVIGVTGVGALVDSSDPGIVEPDSGESATTEFTGLPARVTQAWIERTAPQLSADSITPFLNALRQRGWSEAELAERVRPHLREPT